MRFITTINNQKCLEWEISGTQGALMALLYEANAWAKEIIVDNKVYYFVSKNLILRELPLYYEKVDTVYRHLKVLAQKGIIEYIKQDKKDLIRLTEKGKTWNVIKTKKEELNSEINPSKIENSDSNPTKLGNKSEKNSDSNPANKDNIYYKDINNNYIYLYSSPEFKKAYDDYIEMRKSKERYSPNDDYTIILQLKNACKDSEKRAIEILQYNTMGKYCNKIYVPKEDEERTKKTEKPPKNYQKKENNRVELTADKIKKYFGGTS